MSTLCHDVLIEIMLFLDGPSIVLSCSLVSSLWNKCSKDNIIWQSLFKELFLNDVFSWDSKALELFNHQDSDSNDEGSYSTPSDDDNDAEKKTSKRTLHSTGKKLQKQKKR